MNIFVLDGNENQAVACVRSLSRAGHSVVVGSTFSWSKAGWSRYADGTFTYPAPDRDPLAFVKHIAAEMQKHPQSLILPMTELSMLPLSEHRELIFSAGGRLLLPSHSTVLQAFDKRHTTSLAASLGIATPHTWLINSAAEADQIAEAISYPVVLKPRRSNQIDEDGQLSATGKPLYATNAQEFRSAYGSIARRSSSTLVQEFVEGVGSGYFALMRDGEVRAEFFHRRIRDVRPTGSGSSLRVSIAPQPELRNAGLAVLQALRWHGVAMVEFRVRPDGRPVFVEVNGRFWTSLPLAIHAGVDFPALLVRMAETGDVTAPAGYREGVRCRWFLGDVRHLVETFAGPPAGFPGNFPKRLPTLLSFLKPVRGTYHDNFSIEDPLPEVGDWLHFAAHRVPGFLRKPKSQAANGALGVLHVHSKYSDGEFTLPELKEIFQAAGCKFVCVTDHAESFDDSKLEQYLSECARLSRDDFLFVPGLEYGCEGGMHILGYGCTTLANSKDPQQVIEHIHGHGGIAVIAHPADRMFPAIEEFSVLPHGIEVWNTKYDGRYAPRTGTFHLLERMQQNKPTLRAFYGQDLHWKRQFRGLFTSLNGAATDRKKILDALTQGEFSGTKGDLRLPSSGQLDQDILLSFELEHRNSDRLRKIARYCKDAGGRFGLAVPRSVKSQLRRIF
jgi:predicted ATP-grasp superfamily ATP-dependent carboligase